MVMVHLVPFYKDANFKIKEAPEIIDFVKKKRYDYHKYLECLTETFYRYNPEGKLLLSTDMTTNPVNYQGEYYRQDTSDKTIIQSKVYNETRLICDDNGINENIIMCGTDHLINRKLDKIFLNQDFDIKIPIRKTARVNNAMIVVKKVTDNVKRFFEYRYERFISDAGSDPHWDWYGDQRTYDKILREELNLLPVREPPQKFPYQLGSYEVRGCKVKLIEYGGNECGSFDIWPNHRRGFDNNTYFYDFKGKRKEYFFSSYEKERRNYERQRKKEDIRVSP